MVRTFAEIGVALIIEIGQHVVLVFLRIGSKLVHPAQQGNHARTQHFPDQGQLEHPGKEVAGGHVIPKGLSAIQMAWCRYVQLVFGRQGWIGGVSAIVGTAVGGSDGRFGHGFGTRLLEQWPTVARLDVGQQEAQRRAPPRLASLVEMYKAIAGGKPQLGILQRTVLAKWISNAD